LLFKHTGDGICAAFSSADAAGRHGDWRRGRLRPSADPTGAAVALVAQGLG
jgi:hypothetical protein